MKRSTLYVAAMLSGLLTGCAASRIKPAEVLDERTGMTVGALQVPIEFVQGTQNAGLANTRRASFAYLGPVEWDRMGEITYGLWIHVAPGNDSQIAAINAKGAVTIELDDGALTLTPMEMPGEGRGPYKPMVAWGQTAYFDLNLEMLKHMAASQKMVLQFKSVNSSDNVRFLPSHDTRGALSEFVRTRSINGD